MAGPSTLFQTGDHASRPAASAGCVLYWCTDHEIMYVSSGSAWSNFQNLSAFSGSGIAETLIDAKGDLIAGSAADTAARLAVGTNGHVLTADSGEATGIKWAAAGSSLSTPWVQAHVGGPWIGTMRTSGGANRGFYCPTDILASYTMTGIAIHVGTSSGNISVALYDSSGNRLATSGAVACPAAGTQKVAFTGRVAVTPGRYYMFLSVDNNTATFGFNQYDTSGTALIIGGFQASAHPAPDPATITASGINMPAIVGYMSGGYL